MIMFIGILIGLSGGVFIGAIIMSLCVISSRCSREKEKNDN